MSSFPPPDLITNEIEGEQCWWADDNGPCARPAVTTYYERGQQQWMPVCDDHRNGHPRWSRLLEDEA